MKPEVWPTEVIDISSLEAFESDYKVHLVVIINIVTLIHADRVVRRTALENGSSKGAFFLLSRNC